MTTSVDECQVANTYGNNQVKRGETATVRRPVEGPCFGDGFRLPESHVWPDLAHGTRVTPRSRRAHTYGESSTAQLSRATTPNFSTANK